MEDLSREEVIEAVDRAVEDLLRVAGVEAPPVDAIALAQRHLGMLVCLDRRPIFRGSLQLPSQPLDRTQQALAGLSGGPAEFREKFLDAADDRLGDLPVDSFRNPPSAALGLCRRVELILPAFEKLPGHIDDPVEKL